MEGTTNSTTLSLSLSQPLSPLQENKPRSIVLIGSDYNNYSWKAPSNFKPHEHLYHRDVMNYNRDSNNSNNNINNNINNNNNNENNQNSTKMILHQCIMCGRQDVQIPSQNKNICKFCDSSFWLYQEYNTVFKFCKGCKNFFFLEEFTDKPRGTKCEKCRERGKELYHQKKTMAAHYPLLSSSSCTVSPGSVDPMLTTPETKAKKSRRNHMIRSDLENTRDMSSPSWMSSHHDNVNHVPSSSSFEIREMDLPIRPDFASRPPRKWRSSTEVSSGILGQYNMGTSTASYAITAASAAVTPLPSSSTKKRRKSEGEVSKEREEISKMFVINLPSQSSSDSYVDTRYSLATSVTPMASQDNSHSVQKSSSLSPVLPPNSEIRLNSLTSPSNMVTPRLGLNKSINPSSNNSNCDKAADWHWDPSVNPLMQLALLSSSSSQSPERADLPSNI